MQRAHLCAALGLGLMLSTSSAWAGQVDLFLETRVGGDSNVFRQSRNHTDDGTFDVAPRLGVHDDGDDVSYAFDYQPTYRSFMKTSGIDGVDHNSHGRVGWAISPVDKLEASGSYYNGRQFLFGTSGGAGGSTFSVNDRERIRISHSTLGYRRLLSPRLSGGVDGYFDDFDPSGTSPNSQTDSRAYTGRVWTEYMLTPRTEVGLSSSGRRRENRAVGPFRVTTRTDVWDVLALVSYQVTPSIKVSAQAGPSFIRQQQLPGGARNPRSPSCFQPPDFRCDHYAKDEKSTATLFATASARKEWRTSYLDVAYVRTEARSGNVQSSSSINDEVQINWNLRLSDRLTFLAFGAWDRYEQIVSQQGTAGKYTLINYRTTETIQYALSRRFLLIGQYTYAYQENNSSIPGGSNDVDVHTGFIGLRYTFEPLDY